MRSWEQQRCSAGRRPRRRRPAPGQGLDHAGGRPRRGPRQSTGRFRVLPTIRAHLGASNSEATMTSEGASGVHGEQDRRRRRSRDRPRRCERRSGASHRRPRRRRRWRPRARRRSARAGSPQVVAAADVQAARAAPIRSPNRRRQIMNEPCEGTNTSSWATRSGKASGYSGRPPVIDPRLGRRRGGRRRARGTPLRFDAVPPAASRPAPRAQRRSRRTPPRSSRRSAAHPPRASQGPCARTRPDRRRRRAASRCCGRKPRLG